MKDQHLFGQVQVTGPDATTFLQGQLTCDMRDVTTEPTLGAYCNVKGRVICTFRIHHIEDGFLLEMPSSVIPLVLTQLKKYGAFSKVGISDTGEQFDRSELLLQDIKAGVPHIMADTSGKFTPHMLNLPKLNAVSFNKGCYLGQEIIARTHYRGAAKRVLKYTDNPNTLSSDAVILNTLNQHTLYVE